jgi:hypothetical protein
VRTKGGDRTCTFVHDRQSATTGEDKSHTGMELTTVADVRILVEKHLPKEYRAKFTWRQPQWRLIRPLILLRDLRRTMPGRRGIKRALGNRDYLGFKSPGYGR